MTTKDKTNLLRKQMEKLLELDFERDLDKLADPDCGTDEDAAYQIQMMRKTQRMMNNAFELLDRNFEELDQINEKLDILTKTKKEES